MSESLSPSVELLLEHAGWIKSLAERLVRDPQAADDIAQDALIAAAGRGPRQPGALRAWLAAIVANAARARSRADVRRSRREQSVARTEALPSAHDVVERAELQRRLVEAVLDLDEPYRTVVLLRFYEEREPRDIARMLGQPDATVRTHLARGLARLRTRLDREHGGDRGAWAALVLPAAASGGAIPSSFAGALLVNTPVKIALVAAGMVAVFLLVTRTVGSDATPEFRPVARASEVKSEQASEAPAFATEPRSDARTDAASASPAAVAATTRVTTAAPTLLRGRVLDERGEPRSGVAVGLVPNDEGKMTARATSTASGDFEIAHPRANGRIVADDPALVTLFAGIVESASTSVPAVVVAPAVRMQGSVVDASGRSLEGAVVSVACPEEMRTRIPENLDFSQAQAWSASTDALGAWAFAALPKVQEARLSCTLEGYDPFAVKLGDVLGAPLVITLERPGVREDVVRGRVVDAGGSPVSGAYVALGIETTKSDENGAFAMRTADPKGHNAEFGIEPVKLVATSKGYLPGEATANIVGGRPEWPQHVTLRLGQDALAISGIVKDHLGRERAGILVYVADPTILGEVNGNLAQLEQVMAGTTGRNWTSVKTDDAGRFTITGLCARPYTIRAHDPDTLLRVDAEDVPGGTANLVLAMPRDALYPKVAGHVRSHDGAPIAGARIFPMCDAFQARLKGQIVGTSHDALDGVKTDENGRFEMLDVPKSLVYLRVEREDVLPLEYCRDVPGDSRFTDTPRELPKDRIESLDIRVDRRAHLQVELVDVALADEFALLDEKGNPLEMSVFVGNGRRDGRKLPIVDGKSFVTAGTDRGKTLVLYKAGLEVARRSIKLVPGETTTIRW